MARSSERAHDGYRPGSEDNPLELQKQQALQDPGKSWHDWLIEDFLRYLFLPLVLLESLFAISILSDVTGIPQFNPLLIGATVISILAIEYFYIYRRIWGHSKECTDDESEMMPEEIFDRIK
jgi:hypothetical protein